MLKSGTLVGWMNTWVFIFIFENLPFWALGTRFSLNLLGSLVESIVNSGLISRTLAHL